MSKTPSDVYYLESESAKVDCEEISTVNTHGPFQSFIYSVLIPVVCIPGLMGASVCIFVFTQKQMRSSLNIYLAGLSVFDFILLAMSVMIYPLMETCIQQGDRGNICHIFWYTSVFTYPVSLIAQTGSVWTCVAITVDRFLAVKYPLNMRLWCTSKRAIWVLSFITAFSIIYKIPSFFELSHDECGRVTATSFRNHPLYIVIYITYGNVFILLLIPWFIIIILNVVTVNAVRAAYKMRCQMRMNQRTEDNDRLTKMATVTIVAFIVFNSIAGFNQIIEGFSLKIPGQQYFLTFGNFLVCLNSASNILIYSIFGRKFRKMAFNLICPCILAHYQPLSRHFENKTQVSAI